MPDFLVRRGAAAALAAAALLLAGCAETRLLVHTIKQADGIASAPPAGGAYKVGKPYRIDGAWYYPAEDLDYAETGIASWYGPNFHGKRTANGETYDQFALTAAHRTLPMPSAVRVTNLENGRAIVVRINDRGPFARGRIIDMSRRGAQLLGFEKKGTARVRVEILARESERLKLAAVNRAGGAGLTRAAASPRGRVSAQPLPGGAGGTVALASVGGAGASGTAGTAGTGPPPVELPTGVVVLPVSPTGIFVQAGAFGDFGNALRMRDRLHGLAPPQISKTTIAGSDFFRVRLGPLDSVAQADRLLQRVIDAGVPEARLIVE